VKLLALAVAALALASADVDESTFRYTRTLEATAGGPVHFEPDARLYGHAALGLADLRIVDADDVQVPWRIEPAPPALPSVPVALIARGRRNGVVSVVVDRGAVRPVIDRVELEIPDRTFTGNVTVKGSNTGAEASYATLSTTPIYSVRGAVSARSTTAVFPPTDYRYLLVQARGVSEVTAASVARDPEQAPLVQVEATRRRREAGHATVVRLDLGQRNVPVDAIRIRSTTPTYVRTVRVEGSNDRVTYVPLARAEIARFPGVDLARVVIEAHQRFLRVTIENGDDRPLKALRVEAEAMARPLLVAAGFRPPLRLLYGGAGVPAPSYDFARLPANATGYDEASEGVLGPERVNPLFAAPADTRTFFERNDELIQLLVVLAAVVVAAGGVLALRRRS
jgi:hypothetical protein